MQPRRERDPHAVRSRRDAGSSQVAAGRLRGGEQTTRVRRPLGDRGAGEAPGRPNVEHGHRWIQRETDSTTTRTEVHCRDRSTSRRVEAHQPLTGAHPEYVASPLDHRSYRPGHFNSWQLDPLLEGQRHRVQAQEGHRLLLPRGVRTTRRHPEVATGQRQVARLGERPRRPHRSRPAVQPDQHCSRWIVALTGRPGQDQCVDGTLVERQRHALAGDDVPYSPAREVCRGRLLTAHRPRRRRAGLRRGRT